MTTGRLTDEEKNYYRRVEEYLGGEDLEDAELFSRNVLQQVLKDGVKRVLCDRHGSWATEKLLVRAGLGAEDIQPLLRPVTDCFYQLATSRCGSHVAQTLLQMGARAGLENEVLKIVDCVEAHLDEFLTHEYGSHVISIVVQVMSGLNVSEHVSRSQGSRQNRATRLSLDEKKVLDWTEVPEAYLKKLEMIGKRVGKLSNLAKLVVNACAVPVFRVLLLSLTHCIPARASRLAKKMLKLQSRGEVDLCTHVVGSHLMQTLIEVSSSDVLERVFEKLYKGHVMEYAIHPIANYTLQQVLMSASSKQVSEVVQELENLEEVFFAGHSGVVAKLLEVCVRCGEHQLSLLQNLLRCFHIESSPDKCVPLFLTLTTVEAHTAQNPPMLHGSLILQSLLKFKDPSVVVDGLLGMSSDEVVALGTDPCGSHVVEAFMNSVTVLATKKAELVNLLKGRYITLSKSKHGSRLVESVWRHCTVSQKEAIVSELLASEEELSADFYGKFVLRNVNASHFKRKQNVWQTQQEMAGKRRELFQDIIGDDSGIQEEDIPPRKKKK
eukprot:Em0018g982a